MFDRVLNARLLNASQIPYWDKLGRGVGDKSDFAGFFTDKVLPLFLRTLNVVYLGKREKKKKLFKSKTKLNFCLSLQMKR